MNKDKINEKLDELIEIIETLLGPNGCPWDKKQTTQTMKKHLIEETYEFIDGIDKKDENIIQEELGDLFFMVVFIAKLIEKEYGLHLEESIEAISEKLVRRHPHVFGDLKVKDTKEVLENWEKIKIEEKKGKKVLSGVPGSLPALLKAYRIQEKVGRVGFDWENQDTKKLFAKLDEEVEEFKEAIKNNKYYIDEFGDILFIMVNIGRHFNIDSEEALQKTNNKFIRRFNYIEEELKKENKDIRKMPLEELEKYWEKAKNKEK